MGLKYYIVRFLRDAAASCPEINKFGKILIHQEGHTHTQII